MVIVSIAYVGPGSSSHMVRNIVGVLLEGRKGKRWGVNKFAGRGSSLIQGSASNT